MNKFAASIAALVTVGFAGQVMAASGTASVGVNIEVAEEVSIWASATPITLIMNGANAENSAAAASVINYINNVEANITAAVSGDLSADYNFFLFPGVSDTVAATAAMASNANAPAGALKWSAANPGQSQEVVANTGVNQSVEVMPITYAANAPNILPLPDTFSLTVLYTITSL